MIFLENLKSELEECKPVIAELRDVYDVENTAERIEELQQKAAEPGFWDDVEKSQKVLQETKNLESRLEKYKKFSQSAEDIEVMIEMAAEESEDEKQALTEEIAVEIEEFLDDDAIMEFAAYKMDPSDNDIKAVIVIAQEELGMPKVKDVMRRLLTQVE